jgi:glycosyltransferase involved in cell wall biosynthesis
MTKIVFFVDGFRSGGKERRCIELLKAINNNPEFEIQIVSLRKEIEYDDFYNLNMQYHLIEKGGRLDVSIFFKFYHLCKKIKPDIVHSWSCMNSTYALYAKILLNYKLINSQITDAPNKINWFSQFGIQTKLNFQLSDVILANSYAGLKSYNAPKEKSKCIHNGFDMNRIKNLEHYEIIRKQLEITTKFVICMVGAFVDRKDYETYLDTAKNICNKREDVTFLGIGEGKYLEKFRQSTLNNRRIMLLGRKSNVESIISASDVCVLMTNADVHGEGISNSIMEYMVLGKPVIASKSGGTSEIVVNNETGFLIKNKSKMDLESKIMFLLNDPTKGKIMGLLGRERILKSFNLSSMTEAFMNLYNSLIS